MAALWYNPNWKKRRLLTYTPVGSHTDFVLCINITDASAAGKTFINILGDIKTDGSDIVITESNGYTELQRDVVVSDDGARKQVLVYFRAPQYNINNRIFYLYYSNVFASKNNNLDWSACGYVGAWHFTEDISGAGAATEEPQNSASGGNNFIRRFGIDSMRRTMDFYNARNLPHGYYFVNRQALAGGSAADLRNSSYGSPSGPFTVVFNIGRNLDAAAGAEFWFWYRKQTGDTLNIGTSSTGRIRVQVWDDVAGVLRTKVDTNFFVSLGAADVQIAVTYVPGAPGSVTVFANGQKGDSFPEDLASINYGGIWYLFPSSTAGTGTPVADVDMDEPRVVAGEMSDNWLEDRYNSDAFLDSYSEIASSAEDFVFQAAFSSDITSGNKPLVVTFIDKSTG